MVVLAVLIAEVKRLAAVVVVGEVEPTSKAEEQTVVEEVEVLVLEIRS